MSIQNHLIPGNPPGADSDERFREFHERNSGKARYHRTGVVVPELAVRHGLYVEPQGDELARLTVHRHGKSAFMDLTRDQARHIAALLLKFCDRVDRV